MNDNLINIGGNPNDEFYRYKMSPLKIQVIGKGNGIQTILTNIEEVSNAIGHPTEIISKFISYNTGSNWNLSKKTLTGKHDLVTLQDYINEYIQSFVLCDTCKNPETMYKIEGKKKNINLYVQCASCGYTPKVIIGKSSNDNEKVVKGKNNEKMINFIQKYIKENPMEMTMEKKEYAKENNLLHEDDIF